MCGRYVISSPAEALAQRFLVTVSPAVSPRFNVAPTQPIPIVRLDQGRRQWALVRWGFVPAFVKDPSRFALLINARAEGLADKPAFRNAVRRRRCLVPADGFYEWQRQAGRSQPFFLRPRGGGPLAFAGLWETWSGPHGEEVDTAAIITVAANADVAPIHARMPAILPPEADGPWLDCTAVDAAAAVALLAPAADGEFEAVPVSRAVNRTAIDAPELVEPTLIEPAPAPRRRRRPSTASDQGSLF